MSLNLELMEERTLLTGDCNGCCARSVTECPTKIKTLGIGAIATLGMSMLLGKVMAAKYMPNASEGTKNAVAAGVTVGLTAVAASGVYYLWPDSEKK